MTDRPPPPESEQPTPPRGTPLPPAPAPAPAPTTPTPAQPTTPAQPAPAPAPERRDAPVLPPGTVAGPDRQSPTTLVDATDPTDPTEAHRPRRLRTAALVAALVVGLAGSAWVTSDEARTVWWTGNPHEAVTAGPDGVADLDGLQVSVDEVVDLGPAPALSSGWTPPAGYHVWRVALATTSTNTDVGSTCAVSLVDDEGRRYTANYFVDSFVDGYEFSYRCGATEPGDDTPPVQALLALVPEGVTPTQVFIEESILLDPRYVRLDIP